MAREPELRRALSPHSSGFGARETLTTPSAVRARLNGVEHRQRAEQSCWIADEKPDGHGDPQPEGDNEHDDGDSVSRGSDGCSRENESSRRDASASLATLSRFSIQHRHHRDELGVPAEVGEQGITTREIGIPPPGIDRVGEPAPSFLVLPAEGMDRRKVVARHRALVTLLQSALIDPGTLVERSHRLRRLLASDGRWSVRRVMFIRSRGFCRRSSSQVAFLQLL